MTDYESDSSAGGGGEDIETNTLLAYASRDSAGGDGFSQLGGRPLWLDGNNLAPFSGALAKCKVCDGTMSLLLQLYADLPERFPAHERRLYLFGCRRKVCRRKEGSVRVIRAVRFSGFGADNAGPRRDDVRMDNGANVKPAMNIGETLFGVKSPTPAQTNPFTSSTSGSSSGQNPFSTAAKPADIQSSSPQQQQQRQQQAPADLSETFAAKARISTPSTQPTPSTLPEPWPQDPTPYPSYNLEADKEYLYPNTDTIPPTTRLESETGSDAAATATDDKAAFESSMDKTFQRFADRLAQNPEQVLRYEFAGQPLLYSRSDGVGTVFSSSTAAAENVKVSLSGLFSKIPRCGSCGAGRVFELQLTPHAITMLEVEEMGVDGMDWGTVIVGVCREDCLVRVGGRGEVGYVEEWVGVQWEEVVGGAVGGKKR